MEPTSQQDNEDSDLPNSACRLSDSFQVNTVPVDDEPNYDQRSRASLFAKRKDESDLNDPRQDSDNLFNQKTHQINRMETVIIRQRSSWKTYLESMIDSNFVTAFMTIITVYALFGDDIRLLAFSLSADDVFFSISTFCLFWFAAELIASWIAKENYTFSFYFWLDLVATLSLIPDIGWIWNPIISGGDDDGSGSSDADQIQSAGKASRAGTRTSRVIRIIRLIRLIRIVKLYKNAKAALKKKNEDMQLEEDEDEVHIPSESRVGKKLSDLTTKRVIFLVLMMLLILPLFDQEFYVETSKSWDFGVTALEDYLGKSSWQQALDKYIDYHEDRNNPIVYMEVEENDETWKWEDTDPDTLRSTEKHVAIVDDEITITAVFDLRYTTRIEAGLNIAKTVFVCIVLTLGAIFFTKDANQLVLIPIERMIEKVRRIAKNPLAAAEDDPVDIFKLEEEAEKKSCWDRCCSSKGNDTNEYETQALSNTISKIGALLALGFGEAGTAIIGKNMAKGGDVDPMIAGKKMTAIFGFWDIRQFTDTTEILQEGIMLFTNEIAQIVHGVVDHFQGAANKNIGDAFLLVWKFQQGNQVAGKMKTDDHQIVTKTADLSLISFLKINIKINRSPKILKYRANAKLNERMSNYAVKMGFGLHVGWAIEGAIGSEFKIDASYLSPNVNMASRLEAATKQFGVPLLFTGQLYNMLSYQVQNKCRHIDTVTVKGSKLPIELFTFDMDLQALAPSNEFQDKKSNMKVIHEMKRKKIKNGLIHSTYNFIPAEMFQSSRELQQIMLFHSPEFNEIFGRAVKLYIQGNWEESKVVLEEGLYIKPRDGPSQTLLEVMGELGFKAPADWEGFRELTEK